MLLLLLFLSFVISYSIAGAFSTTVVAIYAAIGVSALIIKVFPLGLILRLLTYSLMSVMRLFSYKRQYGKSSIRNQLPKNKLAKKKKKALTDEEMQANIKNPTFTIAINPIGLTGREITKTSKWVKDIIQVGERNNVGLIHEEIVCLPKYIALYFIIKPHVYKHNGVKHSKKPDEKVCRAMIGTLAYQMDVPESYIQYDHSLEDSRRARQVCFRIYRNKDKVLPIGNMFYTTGYKSFSKKCKKKGAWVSPPLLLGVDNNGDYQYTSFLDSNSHMLMGAITGGGKTTALQSMIYALMFQMKGNVKIHLNDMKGQFVYFDKMPTHSNGIYSTNLDGAIETLDVMTELVDKRFQLFKESGVTDIKGYNTKFPKKPLDFHIIVIEELQRLHSLDGSDEWYKKAQALISMSRSYGVFFIISCQRPDHKVIPESLKANISFRLSFKAATKADSRIVIDTSEAVQLKGNGDAIMYVNNEHQRMQFPYISDGDMKRYHQKYMV